MRRSYPWAEVGLESCALSVNRMMLLFPFLSKIFPTILSILTSRSKLMQETK